MVTTNIYIYIFFIPDEINFIFVPIIEENRCSFVSLPAEVAVGGDLTKAGTSRGSFTYQTLDGAAAWTRRNLPQNGRNY